MTQTLIEIQVFDPLFRQSFNLDEVIANTRILFVDTIVVSVTEIHLNDQIYQRFILMRLQFVRSPIVCYMCFHSTFFSEFVMLKKNVFLFISFKPRLILVRYQGTEHVFSKFFR